MKVSGALFGGAGGLLHELTGSLRDFHVLEVLERFGDGSESFLDGVQHGTGLGLGGHLGFSILRG